MEADRLFKTRIVKECCRSLCYDAESRQFSFSLRPCLPDKWQRLSIVAKNQHLPFFTLDFNDFIARVDRASKEFIRIPYIYSLTDSQILNGEIIELTFDNQLAFSYVKMGCGQYLCCQTGVGFTFGSLIEFKTNMRLLNAEGYFLGTIERIALLAPAECHLCIDGAFFGNFFRKSVGSSLWSLFEIATTIVDGGNRSLCTELMQKAITLGIGSLPLLSIVNSATRQHEINQMHS